MNIIIDRLDTPIRVHWMAKEAQLRSKSHHTNHVRLDYRILFPGAGRGDITSQETSTSSSPPPFEDFFLFPQSVH